MKNFLSIVLIVLVAWFAYGKYMESVAQHSIEVDKDKAERKGAARIATGEQPLLYASDFKCDGRNTCAQMRTCEEAKFFLKNCSTVRMDNNSDGIPCETGVCSSQ